jgi:hypothetical protein
MRPAIERHGSTLTDRGHRSYQPSCGLRSCGSAPAHSNYVASPAATCSHNTKPSGRSIRVGEETRVGDPLAECKRGLARDHGDGRPDPVCSIEAARGLASCAIKQMPADMAAPHVGTVVECLVAVPLVLPPLMKSRGHNHTMARQMARFS